MATSTDLKLWRGVGEVAGRIQVAGISEHKTYRVKAVEICRTREVLLTFGLLSGENWCVRVQRRSL